MSSMKIGEVNGVMVHFPGHQALEKLLSKLSHCKIWASKNSHHGTSTAAVTRRWCKGIGSFLQYLTLVPLDDNDDDADDNN